MWTIAFGLFFGWLLILAGYGLLLLLARPRAAMAPAAPKPPRNYDKAFNALLAGVVVVGLFVIFGAVGV